MSNTRIIASALAVAGVLSMLLADAAQARDFYCRHSGIRNIYDGGEFDENWEVVNSSVRRVQMPGQTNPTTGCHISWRSVGGFYRPPEIIEAPRPCSARPVSNYRIFYQSPRNGQDPRVPPLHWIKANPGHVPYAVG